MLPAFHNDKIQLQKIKSRDYNTKNIEQHSQGWRAYVVNNQLKSITYKIRISYNVYYCQLFTRLTAFTLAGRAAAPGVGLPAQPAGNIPLFAPRILRVHNSRTQSQKPGRIAAFRQSLKPVRRTCQSVLSGALRLVRASRKAALPAHNQTINSIYQWLNSTSQHLKTWQPAFLFVKLQAYNAVHCQQFTRLFFDVNSERHSINKFTFFNDPGRNQKPASQRGRVFVSYVGRAGLGLAQ